MGVKKLTLLVLLVVSVCGQDPIVEDNGVSDNVLAVENVGNVEPVPQAEAAKVEEDELLEDGSPMEMVPGTEQLEVRSGKYQLNDGLVGEQPVNLDAVDFNSINGESEKQLLFPDATSTYATNNEYGKLVL